VNLVMHPETVIEHVSRCTWRPESCEFGDTHGGRNRVNLEIHSEAVI